MISITFLGYLNYYNFSASPDELNKHVKTWRIDAMTTRDVLYGVVNIFRLGIMRFYGNNYEFTAVAWYKKGLSENSYLTSCNYELCEEVNVLYNL